MKSFQLITILVFGLLFSQSASAYLDPGTGSLILQMLIAGIVGAIFTIKLYWYRFTAFLAKLFGKDDKTENNLDNDSKPDKE